jgi:hypothetical protein
MHPTTRSTILSAVVLAVCAACSGGGAAGRTPREAEVSAAEAKAEHRVWSGRLSAFRERASAAIAEGALLRHHPGWPEMQKIIRARPSLRRFDGEDVAREKTAAALAEWNRRWNSPGESLLRAYDTLAAQSQRLETERIGLLEQRHEVWKRGNDGILRQIASARSAAEMQALNGMLARWNRLRDEDLSVLEAYGLDALGLYQRRGGD